jgi:tetratricopeptide (TPR) repeat protein
VNLRKTATIQYIAAATAALLAVFVAYKSYAAWKFYSYTELALKQYNSASYGPAHATLSSFTSSYRPEDPQVIAFEAHLLSLQEYHDKAASSLEKSGLTGEGIIKLALGSEKLFVIEAPGDDMTPGIILLEAASQSYEYPDGLVALGGACLRAGELEEAEAKLRTAQEEAGKLSFDGLIALWINLGVLHTRLARFELAAESFKKVMELLPERKLPPLAGMRAKARTSGQRGLVLACVKWLTNEEAKPDKRKVAVEYVKKLLDQKQATARGPKDRWDLGAYRCILLNALGVAQGKLKLYKEALRTLTEALNEARRLRTENREYVRHAITLNRAVFPAKKLESNKLPASKGELTNVAKALTDAAAKQALPAKWRYAAYNLSAQFYLRAGSKRQTEKTLKKAIELMPEQAAALVNLAVFYDKQDKKAQAIEFYEKALELENLTRRAEVERRVAKLKE